MIRSRGGKDIYTTISNCELCGRKLIKGYFLVQKDRLKSEVVKVVCWRCKLFQRSVKV